MTWQIPPNGYPNAQGDAPTTPWNPGSPYPLGFRDPSGVSPPPPPGVHGSPQRAGRWALAFAMVALGLVIVLALLLVLPQLNKHVSLAAGPVATATVAPPTPTPVPPFQTQVLANNTGISSDANPGGANFDSFGNSYSQEALLAAGFTPGAPYTYNGVNFTWPTSGTGSADNMLVQHQTLAVRATQSFSTLAFLGASHFGGAQTTIVLTYTDGTTQSAQLGLSDWTELQFGIVQYGNAVVATLPYYHSTSGKVQKKSYIFYAEVALNPAKTLQSIQFPNRISLSQMHIFCVGVR